MQPTNCVSSFSLQKTLALFPGTGRFSTSWPPSTPVGKQLCGTWGRTSPSLRSATTATGSVQNNSYDSLHISVWRINQWSPLWFMQYFQTVELCSIALATVEEQVQSLIFSQFQSKSLVDICCNLFFLACKPTVWISPYSTPITVFYCTLHLWDSSFNVILWSSSVLLKQLILMQQFSLKSVCHV